MSEYYKAEDVIRAIEEMQNGYNGWSDTYDKAQIIGVLEELPTIEVSEDNEPTWEQVKEYCFKRNFAIVGRETPKEYTRGYAEVSEDAIDRGDLISDLAGIWDTYTPNNMTDFQDMLEDIDYKIRNAPSVVPSRAECEWIIDEPPLTGYGTIYTCPLCGHEEEFEPTNYCPNCGARCVYGNLE